MIRAEITFRYAERDILKIGRIISTLFFKSPNMFKGLEEYLRDEVPFIFTDNFLGCYLGIMQNPDETDLFCLEIVDTLNKGSDIDLTERLLYSIKDCSQIELVKQHNLK